MEETTKTWNETIAIAPKETKEFIEVFAYEFPSIFKDAQGAEWELLYEPWYNKQGKVFDKIINVNNELRVVSRI